MRIHLLTVALLTASVVGLAADNIPTAPADLKVAAVPESLRTALKLSPFYIKYVDAHGFPVLGSEKVSDAGILEAARIVDKMLDDRDDVRQAMVKNKVRLAVMAPSEQTTDIPEHSDLTPKEYWNQRARGLGATRQRPAVSCAEENVLHLKGDRYPNENILVHEFAHAIHEMGLNTVDPKFDETLVALFKKSVGQRKLWRRTYATTNHKEYWAEGVQSYFDCNDNNNTEHNDVCTRERLSTYDPEFFALIDTAFKHSSWHYERPGKLKPPRPTYVDALLNVENRSGVEVVFYWLNGASEAKKFTLAPGDKRAVETFVGDRWRARIKGRESAVEHKVSGEKAEWVVE